MDLQGSPFYFDAMAILGVAEIAQLTSFLHYG